MRKREYLKFSSSCKRRPILSSPDDQILGPPIRPPFEIQVLLARFQSASEVVSYKRDHKVNIADECCCAVPIDYLIDHSLPTLPFTAWTTSSLIRDIKESVSY